VKRETIDFHSVPAHQDRMHARLENWGRWSSPPQTPDVAPGFDRARSDEIERETSEARDIRPPVDVRDAIKVQAAMHFMPTKHRQALAWYYVTPCTPIKACRLIGCTPVVLAELVDDGRNILMNRGV
jgi:hypothetical protein